MTCREWLADNDDGNSNLQIDTAAISSAAAYNESNVDKVKRRFLCAVLCAVLSSGVVIGALYALSPAVVYVPANTTMRSLGPMDTLGQKAYNFQSPISSDTDVVLPYDERAVAVKRRSEILASNMRNEPAILTNSESEHKPEPTIDTHFDVAESSAASEQPIVEKPVAIPGAASVSPSSSRELSEVEIQHRDQELINQKIADATSDSAGASPSREWLFSHPQKNAFKSVIVISGEVIPLITNRDRCPDSAAGVWRGENSVTDNKGMYILGHNPGVFHSLIEKNYRVGNTFTVWDEHGDGRVYTITDVFTTPVGAQFDAAHQARTINSGGECVVLQTCIDNSKRYKIFVAH